MSVFYAFKIAQMLSNRAKHHNVYSHLALVPCVKKIQINESPL